MVMRVTTSTYKLEKVPRDIGYYLAGFVDGEGSFSCVIRQKNDYKIGWKFTISFNVTSRDIIILTQLKKYLGCGIIRQRKDESYIYEIESFQLLKNNIIPFFKKYKFRSATKKAEFHIFQKMVNLKESSIDSKEKVLLFLTYRQKLGEFRKSGTKYSDEFILSNLRIEESSETTR